MDVGRARGISTHRPVLPQLLTPKAQKMKGDELGDQSSALHLLYVWNLEDGGTMIRVCLSRKASMSLPPPPETEELNHVR